MARYVELRRHTDSEGDALTEEGVRAALAMGGRLTGGYELLVSSGAQRATQTLACSACALRDPVPGGLSDGRRLDSWESARLFGLLDMAMADGYVSSFDTKYHYRYWRPVTAIRAAGSDGNPATTSDPTWTPLATTPPIPDYDFAHAVEGGAAAQVFQEFFGTDRTAFGACSLTLPGGQRCTDAAPVSRSYASFSQAAEENGVSRILVGYHFRKAVREGTDHGRQIGRLRRPASCDPCDSPRAVPAATEPVAAGSACSGRASWPGQTSSAWRSAASSHSRLPSRSVALTDPSRSRSHFALTAVRCVTRPSASRRTAWPSGVSCAAAHLSSEAADRYRTSPVAS